MSTLRVGRMPGVKRERAAGAKIEGKRARKVSRSGMSPNGVRRDVDGDSSDDGDDVQDTPARETSEPDRCAVRSKYAALKMQMNSCKGQLAQAENPHFKDILDIADNLHKHVKKPREQVKDAELHIGISAELLDVARNAKMKGGMSCDDFLNSILKKFGISAGEESGRVLDLEAFGRAACGVVRIAPGLSTMVGPMDVEVKPRQERPRATQDRVTQVTQPGRVADADPDGPSTETDANMQEMFNLLRDRKLVLFDHLILNRHSFAQTVENVFALSFLVKDGRVEIKTNADEMMEVAPRNAPSHSQRANGEVRNSQYIFRMDMKCWRIMRERIPAGAEIMPHRGELNSPHEDHCVRLSDGEQEVPSTRIRKSRRV